MTENYKVHAYYCNEQHTGPCRSQPAAETDTGLIDAVELARVSFRDVDIEGRPGVTVGWQWKFGGRRWSRTCNSWREAAAEAVKALAQDGGE